MTCAVMVRVIYACMAQEDKTMTLERARDAHAEVCGRDGCRSQGGTTQHMG